MSLVTCKASGKGWGCNGKLGSWVPRGLEREINNKYHGGQGARRNGGVNEGCVMLICGTEGPARCPPPRLGAVSMNSHVTSL